MAATRAQQIGIWIIAVIMTIGTIGSFLVIILANDNQQSDQARLQQVYEEYQKKTDAQVSELSEAYYDDLNAYSSRVGAFDAASVTDLKTEDLKVGDGETLTKESGFTAYYIGWNPTGKIFDSSIENGALKAPYGVTPGYVISGWSEGVEGMNVGGVRQITIPADKAYGSVGQGEDIPADTPLRFIIMVIPTPDAVPYPEELLQQ